MGGASLQRRAAIRAAGAAMVAAFTVAAPPAAYADGQWGAIVFSGFVTEMGDANVFSGNGAEMGLSTNFSSEAEAVQSARMSCGIYQLGRCNIQRAFAACGAVAQSGEDIGALDGSTKQEAEQAALRLMGRGSVIRMSGCNDGGQPTSERR